jgi:glucose-1-phosphate thymidylyltransferase
VTTEGFSQRFESTHREPHTHLLSLFNQPMIYCPIQTVMNAGLQEIFLEPEATTAGIFAPLLGNGRPPGVVRLLKRPQN